MEMQVGHEERQESIVKEMRSQLHDKDDLHQRIVTGMRREYLKVMEDTSEQRQNMIKGLQKRNRQNEKEHGDVVDDLYRKQDAELREASGEGRTTTDDGWLPKECGIHEELDCDWETGTLTSPGTSRCRISQIGFKEWWRILPATHDVIT